MKAGWEVREGAKAEEHPHIVKMANELDRRYQMSLSKQPLEIGEVHCYNRAGATDKERTLSFAFRSRTQIRTVSNADLVSKGEGIGGKEQRMGKR